MDLYNDVPIECLFKMAVQMKEAHLGFLRAGGQRFPIETLRAGGVDMLSPEPIEK